jgi:hypothetical protein
MTTDSICDGVVAPSICVSCRHHRRLFVPGVVCQLQQYL